MASPSQRGLGSVQLVGTIQVHVQAQVHSCTHVFTPAPKVLCIWQSPAPWLHVPPLAACLQTGFWHKGVQANEASLQVDFSLATRCVYV